LLPSTLNLHRPHSGYQAHDVSGAAELLSAFHEDYLQLQREHKNLQSMMSRKALAGLTSFFILNQKLGQSLALETVHRLQVPQSRSNSKIEPSQSLVLPGALMTFFISFLCLLSGRTQRFCSRR
jgi:hypothetical protein